jgi:hypothetical protein
MELMTYELETELTEELNPGVVKEVHVSEWAKSATIDPFTNAGNESEPIENWDTLIPRPTYF